MLERRAQEADEEKKRHTEQRHALEGLIARLQSDLGRKSEVVALSRTIVELRRTHEDMAGELERLREQLIENENFLRSQEGQISARFEKELGNARCQVRAT
jgi:hypothetical protein